MDNIIRYITENTTALETESCTQERSSAITAVRLPIRASQGTVSGHVAAVVHTFAD
jgi:hypothetical protein